jgi:three-Cys-motif partner protein
VLLENIFPNVKYENYRRALCLLDPYGLHLKWEVIQTAGRMGTIDMFLNFPIMDMNRNALWRNPELTRET